MAEAITIARPYAKAVFDLAVAEQRLPHWGAALTTLADIIRIPAVAALIEAPEVGAAARASVLVEICGDTLDDQGRNFVRLLSEKRRLECMPDIVEEFARLRAEAEAVIDVELAAAVEVDEPRQQELRAALARHLGREVRLKCVLDETLLGGAVIRAGDLVIDASIRGRLDRLAAEMSH